VTQSQPLNIGIDATNIRGGGSVTHLVELLRAARTEVHSIGRGVVLGGMTTLTALEDQSWLAKQNSPLIYKVLLQRTIW